MEYQALLIWETDRGEPITNGFVKSGLEIVSHLIVPLYNKACELLNPHYEAWNLEFEEHHPNLDGNDREYNEFIMKRSNKILEGRCEKNGMSIRCAIIEDDVCELVGYYAGYRCKFRIKPV